MSQNVTFKNSCGSVIYVTVEWSSGHSNFPLTPGDTHPYLMDPENTPCRFCWAQDKAPDRCGGGGTPMSNGDFFDICGEEEKSAPPTVRVPLIPAQSGQLCCFVARRCRWDASQCYGQWRRLTLPSSRHPQASFACLWMSAHVKRWTASIWG